MKKENKTCMNLPAGLEIIYDDVVFARVEDLDDSDEEDINLKKHVQFFTIRLSIIPFCK